MIDPRDHKTRPLFPLTKVVTAPNTEIKKWAVLDETKTFRYILGRQWDTTLPNMLCICLNPSTADENTDDRTTAKIVKYARNWGHGSVAIVNLFAYRATKPEILRKYEDALIVGNPDNDKFLQSQVEIADRIVCGWGSRPFYYHHERLMQVLPMLEGKPLWCWKLGNMGDPAHPLYLDGKITPIRYTPNYKGRPRKDISTWVLGEGNPNED